MSRPELKFEFEIEDVLDGAVDEGWRFRTAAPRGSFSGSLRAAARCAVELYKQYILKEPERIAELTARVVELEITLRSVGCAVSLSVDSALPPEELHRILQEVRSYMEELQKVKIERGSFSRKLNDAEYAIARGLQLMLNKEHLRKRFKTDAHWIRFIRDLRHTLTSKED